MSNADTAIMVFLIIVMAVAVTSLYYILYRLIVMIRELKESLDYHRNHTEDWFTMQGKDITNISERVTDIDHLTDAISKDTHMIFAYLSDDERRRLEKKRKKKEKKEKEKREEDN